MATSLSLCKSPKLTLTTLVILLSILTSSASARLFLNDFLSEEADATDQHPKQQLVMPCHEDMQHEHAGVLRRFPRVTGKYGPMILSMLPKGKVPSPSGPSKGGNGLKN